MRRRWFRRDRIRVVDNHEAEVLLTEARRLTGPRGRVVWICATGAGRKDDCNHDTEAQAEAHGAREGRVWWPVTIDDGERSA